ncbi:MAG: TOBE domain-containing protein [Thermoplasmata archaeon]
MSDRRRGSPREKLLTPVDLRLLASLERERNMVRACRSIDIRRDRGVYRLRRLERLLGHPLVRSRLGRGRRGTTELTAAGLGLLRTGRGASTVSPPRGSRPAESVVLRGSWSSRGGAHLRLERGPVLWVGFRAPAGERIAVAIDPEAVLVARRRILTSARNLLAGNVRSIRRVDASRQLLGVDVGGLRITAVVTPESVRALRLTRGSRAYLYIKATAIRRIS